MTQFWFYSQRVEIFVRLVRGVAPAPCSQLCSVRQFPQSECGEDTIIRFALVQFLLCIII